jgi:hypothetical protein
MMSTRIMSMPLQDSAFSGECASADGILGCETDPSETVIRRNSSWKVISPAELWRYRELLFYLIWRDLKLRYKQAAFGAAWAILQPLLMMVVFSLFLARLAGGNSADVPYSVFVLCGLLPWSYFGNAISSAGQSVIGNRQLITKVYFPRLLIPMGTVGAGLVDFADRDPRHRQAAGESCAGGRAGGAAGFAVRGTAGPRAGAARG